MWAFQFQLGFYNINNLMIQLSVCNEYLNLRGILIYIFWSDLDYSFSFKDTYVHPACISKIANFLTSCVPTALMSFAIICDLRYFNNFDTTKELSMSSFFSINDYSRNFQCLYYHSVFSEIFAGIWSYLNMLL